jgi:hypothetical protein
LEKTVTSILQFKGRITFEKIGILLHDLKNKKQDLNIQPVVYKKLLTLMIEVLENVLKYSDVFEEFVKDYPGFSPEFELSQENDTFTLVSRNPVLKDDCEAIIQKIDRINASDEEALKKFYLETITNGMFTEKGGAGLGIIEMAKVVDEPIGYRFSDTVQGFKIYELRLIVKNTET